MPTESEIRELVREFEATTLPRGRWTHEAHLIVGLVYLIQHPREVATGLLRQNIQRYNQSLGNTSGYHETITLAWVAAICEFLRRHDRDAPVADLADALIDECGTPGYLFQFYSRDRLLSEEARSRWVAPDLKPIEKVEPIPAGNFQP